MYTIREQLALLYVTYVEKEMATHSIILAWRIPWTEEPGGLQSLGLQRVGHDWVTEPCMLDIEDIQYSDILAGLDLIKIYIFTQSQM